MFGYKALSDSSTFLAEKYISLSGAIILGLLSREFQSLELIIEKLMNIFADVDYFELKQDVLDFFMLLVNKGYPAIKASFDDGVETRKNRLAKLIDTMIKKDKSEVNILL